MKTRAFTLIEAIVCVAIIVILAAILFPVFATNCYPSSPRTNCITNLKQAGLGFIQYTQDYGDRFPDVAAAGGWAVAVQPYIKSWQVFHCPSTSSRNEKTTDYFYNSRLARANREKIEDFTVTILMADGVAGQAPNTALSQLPDAWRKDMASPAWRHLEMANYLFVGGHAKSLKPDKITLAKPALGKPTFLVK